MEIQGVRKWLCFGAWEEENYQATYEVYFGGWSPVRWIDQNKRVRPFGSDRIPRFSWDLETRIKFVMIWEKSRKQCRIHESRIAQVL
jgi:hypothetical protein